jgi:hypothetical protein
MLKRIRRFAVLGFLFGCFLSAWALIVFLIIGPERFGERGTPLLLLILLYLTAGPVAGAVVGALLPLWRSTPGALLLGWSAALPVAVLIRTAAVGLHNWDRLDLEGMAIIVIVGGSVCALATRSLLRS